jgi:hypothetical protein
MRLRRALRWGGAIVLLLGLAIAAPVVGIETVCRGAGPAAAPAPGGKFGIADPGYGMPATNSVLSYPEWYIVYAYQDFAGVLHEADESAFRYLASITGYWTGFCAVNRVAIAQGGGDFGEKVMLYVIGVSFTAELVAKGAYETTIGRLSAWLRGAEKTSEDRLAASVSEEYAGFLLQRPWYEFPFQAQVRRLWHETPFGTSSYVRAIERRFALTTEWTVKSLYAQAIGASAGLDPAVLHIESVVSGLDASDLAALSGVAVRADLGEGRTLIMTPRYAAFTQILADLAARGRQVLEIAGNDTIFLTALVPNGADFTSPGARAIFAEAIQSRPGWRRVGIVVKVPELTRVIREIQTGGATLEHVYDY